MDWKEEIRNRNEIRRRLNRLAWLLDSSIPIPGTRFSIGIDALIGLVPFLGDLVGVLLSSRTSRSARNARACSWSPVSWGGVIALVVVLLLLSFLALRWLMDCC